jgi:hypothetical protein
LGGQETDGSVRPVVYNNLCFIWCILADEAEAAILGVVSLSCAYPIIAHIAPHAHVQPLNSNYRTVRLVPLKLNINIVQVNVKIPIGSYNIVNLFVY